MQRQQPFKPTAIFDVNTFNIRDTVALQNLKRQELRALCELHDAHCARSNEETIANLQSTLKQRTPLRHPVHYTYPNTSYYTMPIPYCYPQYTIPMYMQPNVLPQG